MQARSHPYIKAKGSSLDIASTRCARSRLLRHRVASTPPEAVQRQSLVEQLRHITQDGTGLELLLQRANLQGDLPERPPLLFVHGSYHAAWCWADHFLPYFAARGFNSYAVSLRAQGNSDCVSQDKGGPIQVAGTLDSHAADLADLISNFPQPPVVVGHSFGGLILQRYVQLMAARPGEAGLPPLAGTAFLACVPPSGNKSMVLRFLLRDPILSLKVTWGFVARSFIKDVKACRELFFSPDLPDADLARHHAQLATCSPVRLMDLADVNKQVPLPPPPSFAPPAFVLGGADDKVVDVEAIQELAASYGVEPIILPNMAHDVMLDTRWEQVAERLAAWLDTLSEHQS
ncbi:esterase-like protein [Haematococcus lacustris]